MLIKSSILSPRNLDLFEKYTLSIIFTFFVYRSINGYMMTGSAMPLIYLLDQFIVLLFLLIRRTTNDISMRLDDWIVGYVSTFLALLFGPVSQTPLIPVSVAIILMFSGLAIHLSAKIILRRSFGVVAANRGVKMAGPYRIVRHPMYLGYMVTQLGLVLGGPTLHNVVIAGCCWTLFIWRILAEERVLRQDEAYANLPRYRLIPGVF